MNQDGKPASELSEDARFTVEDGPTLPQQRPMSLAWITDDLVTRTRDVWGRASGQAVSESEAIEILLNVKRFAEITMYSRREG
jgi:hypothetical protein